MYLNGTENASAMDGEQCLSAILALVMMLSFRYVCVREREYVCVRVCVSVCGGCVCVCV